MAKDPTNHRKAWGAAEVKQLKELAAGNTPTRVIGLKLGRSEHAIRGKAGAEKVSLRPTNRSPYGAGKK